jgi:hypothetical protein
MRGSSLHMTKREIEYDNLSAALLSRIWLQLQAGGAFLKMVERV